ncbi:acyltransferase [Hydrogenophaga crocea]|uniref:Acyltransferase n=1 Tax=Hydrogenophaga crocea TaxID=2716225 RepID=A0A6G8ILD8_9BURK|nr:acyltransferase [Hydrogenophaga crocea]QIM53981.1 acyltransferase [Hydrogenophaga crocea]
MKSVVRWLFHSVAALAVKRRVRVVVGSNTRVRWAGLLGQSQGQLAIGDQCIINCRIDFDGPDGSVHIGNRCFIGKSHLVCRERITIGDDVVISWGVTVVDHNSHALDWEHRQSDVVDWAQGRKDWTHIQVRPVVIRDKAWIGFGATILKGVEIGEGSIVGAGAVVTKDVEAFTVVAGNPANVIKRIHENANNAN